MTQAPPPKSVLQSFGLRGIPQVLPGGRGQTWRVANAVVKPADLPLAELEWQARALGRVDQRAVRLSAPLRTQDGQLVKEGWVAYTYLPGHHEPQRWQDIIEVGQLLHEQLRSLPRPVFMADRSDPWAVADRVAWDEESMHPFLRARHVLPLTVSLRPVHAPCQVIHGDLTGNVLFSEQDRPAVIDLSFYWRPAVYASAIVVADALVWEGAKPRDFEPLYAQPDFVQCLLRALLFRRISEELHLGSLPEALDQDPYSPVVAFACALAEQQGQGG